MGIECPECKTECAESLSESKAREATYCLETVKKALDAGVPRRHPVRVSVAGYANAKKFSPKGQGEYWMVPMSSLHSACKKYMARWDLQRAAWVAENVRDRTKQFDENPKYYYHAFDMALKDCVEITLPLLKNGVSKQTVLTLADGSKLTLIEAWRECKVVLAKLKAYDKAQADAKRSKQDAALAPYKKVLEGEKLSFWLNNKFHEIELFGKNGVRLSTPAALQKANLWFVVVNFKGDDGKTWWELRRYAFKKGKYVGDRESKGRGMYPPSKAFR